MNSFVLELWDDEGAKCTFYTVRWDGEKENETNRFLETYFNQPDYEEATSILLTFVLRAIGERHGAHKHLLNRHENEVIGLPVKGFCKLESTTYHYPNFPLRLFALKLSDEIMVLFGGGIKDAETAQKSSLSMQWRDACAFANAIWDGLKDGMFEIDENQRKLKAYDGSDEILLP